MHEACRWNNHRAKLQLLCCGSLQVVVELLLLLRWKGRRCSSACKALAENTRLLLVAFPSCAAKGRSRQHDRSSVDSQKAGEPPRHESIPSDCCRSTTAVTTASSQNSQSLACSCHHRGLSSRPYLLRLDTCISSNVLVRL